MKQINPKEKSVSNIIVRNQTAPRSSLIRDCLFLLSTVTDYFVTRMALFRYRIIPFHFRNSALKEERLLSEN